MLGPSRLMTRLSWARVLGFPSYNHVTSNNTGHASSEIDPVIADTSYHAPLLSSFSSAGIFDGFRRFEGAAYRNPISLAAGRSFESKIKCNSPPNEDKVQHPDKKNEDKVQLQPRRQKRKRRRRPKKMMVVRVPRGRYCTMIFPWDCSW